MAVYGEYSGMSAAAAAKKIRGYMKVDYNHVISGKRNFTFGFLPGAALVDLRTMKVVLKDSMQKQYSAREMIQKCKSL